jgi:hypothetical protein
MVTLFLQKKNEPFRFRKTLNECCKSKRTKSVSISTGVPVKQQTTMWDCISRSPTRPNVLKSPANVAQLADWTEPHFRVRAQFLTAQSQLTSPPPRASDGGDSGERRRRVLVRDGGADPRVDGGRRRLPRTPPPAARGPRRQLLQGPPCFPP